jgi:aldehyde:ferredoxin oxidoreductase
MSFVADPTPGRHTDSNYDMGQLGMSDFFPDLKPLIEIAKDPYQQGKSSVVPVKLHQVMESMGLCLFSYFFSDYRMLEMLAVVTGWEMTAEKNFEIGGRIQTIRQMFNACEGAIRHEITPRAVGNPPQQKGPLAGKTIDVATMARGYYDGMGFQSDGITTAEILKSYGLDEMIPDLAICTGAHKPIVNDYIMRTD